MGYPERAPQIPVQNLTIRMDFDGCWQCEVEAMSRIFDSARLDRSTDLERLRDCEVTRAQLPILCDIINLIESCNPEVITVISFSNRQDFLIEWTNGIGHFKDRYYYNNRSISSMARFSSVYALILLKNFIKALFPHKDVILSQFLTADIVIPYKLKFSKKRFYYIDETFTRIYKHFKANNTFMPQRAAAIRRLGDPFLSNEGYFDKWKLLMSYVQLQYFDYDEYWGPVEPYLYTYGQPRAATRTLVVSYDDTKDLLQALYKFHRRNRELTPRGYDLLFKHYSHADEDKLRLATVSNYSPEHYEEKIITGSGAVNKNWRETYLHMIERFPEAVMGIMQVSGDVTLLYENFVHTLNKKHY